MYKELGSILSERKRYETRRAKKREREEERKEEKRRENRAQSCGSWQPSYVPTPYNISTNVSNTNLSSLCRLDAL
jgi:hypothetical protein